VSPMCRNRPPLALAALLLTAQLLAALSGCARAGEAAGKDLPDPAAVAFGVPEATAVLAAFDSADSAASSAGDLAGLRGQEVSPSLDGSVAAVNKARHFQRKQPGFQHVEPAFALPATGDPGCFLVTAKLRLAGEELPLTDVSHFTRTPEGTWKISHNVQVAPDGVATVRALAGAAAGASEEALAGPVRQRLAAQVFARTTGSGSRDTALLASGTLLDQQFAGGWAIYTQQMTEAGMTVTRTLDRAGWSPCAARTTAGTLVFLTLNAHDTVTRSGGAAGDVTLPATAPDLIALGRPAAARGHRLRVSRVETFLLLVPPAGPARLLGLGDAPTSLAVEK